MPADAIVQPAVLTDRGPRRKALRTAYFQCIGGASGDMILGALVAAGVPLEDIKDALVRLKVEGFSLSLERATRGGVSGTAGPHGGALLCSAAAFE